MTLIMLRPQTMRKPKQLLVLVRRKQLLQNNRPGAALVAAPMNIQRTDVQALAALALLRCEQHKHQSKETSNAREAQVFPRIGVLPVELQRELSLPSVADSVVDSSKRVARGIVQEIRVANTRPKVGMIQEVEELGPEFEVGAFSRPEFLEDREI